MSVMYAGKAKHIMIERDQQKYFITRTEKEIGFDNIQLMVNHFRKHTLEHTFSQLQTPLVHPIRMVKKGV